MLDLASHTVREQLRSQMPVSRTVAYFDHAAVAPLTAPAAQAIADYAAQARDQGDLPWLDWSATVARLRTDAASLLGASPDEVALVPNTTHGIGLVAEGFPWQAGDNVVIPDNEFPSNVLAWKWLQRLGVELRRVPVDDSGKLDLSLLANAIDSRTRIVSLSWVGFSSGYRVPVGEVAELVHSRGGLFMLDAIQGLGAFEIDVAESQVDFLAADGHKWLLGPEGAGLLYVRHQHLDLLQPLGLGWNSLQSGGFDPNSSHIKNSAARYEGGSTNMPGMLGLQASLGLLKSLHELKTGPGELSPISAVILDNVQWLSEQLQRAGFEVHMPFERKHRSGIIGITWPNLSSGSQSDAEKVYLAARKHCLATGVAVSVRAGRLRASTHAYNNEEDMQRLVDALVGFRKL